MIATVLIIAAGILVVMQVRSRLATDRNAVTTGCSGIDLQSKRRHDLFPVLAGSVRGAMARENGVFDQLLYARGAATGARNDGVGTVQAARAELSVMLRALVARALRPGGAMPFVLAEAEAEAVRTVARVGLPGSRP